MRIIMGTAYSLQHMHELKPPIPRLNLLSSSIFVSEDFAAKVADIDVWKEIFANVKTHGDDDLDHSESLSADPANDVYSFGILLLEIVSGKVPCSEEQVSLLNLVVEYLNGNGGVVSLVDPTLKTHKDQELETICEVIRDCINLDPRKRPSMKEVTSKLRDVIQISPEVATCSTLVGGAGDRICRSKLTRSLFPCRIMRQPPSGIWLSQSSCKPQSTYLSSLYCTMEDPSASSLAIAIDCEPSGLPVGPARDQGVSIQIHCELEYV